MTAAKRHSPLLGELVRTTRRDGAPALRGAFFAMQRALLEHALNITLRDVLDSGALEPLHGRYLRIHVEDTGWHWDISCSRVGLVLGHCREPDVTMSASLHSYLQIATRRTDPDTLFFQRRLHIRGDTELGLCCKNALDAIEADRWPLLLRRALYEIKRRL